MPTAIEIGEIISETTGVSGTTVQTIIRRLGDARLIPRSRRGKTPASMEPVHAARILTAVLVAADHFDGTAAAVVDLVPIVEALEAPLAIDVYMSEAGAMRFAPSGGFIDWLAVNFQSPTQATSVGLTFSGGEIFGWSDLEDDIGSYRVVFGVESESGAFARHYELSADILVSLRQAFEEDQELPLGAATTKTEMGQSAPTDRPESDNTNRDPLATNVPLSKEQDSEGEGENQSESESESENDSQSPGSAVGGRRFVTESPPTLRIPNHGRSYRPDLAAARTG